MKTEHTKGDWHVAPSLSGKTFITTSEKIGMAGLQICEVITDIDEGSPQANAKLIAAAPDLLEALHALYTYPQVRELLAPNGSLGSISDKVEAAINKATA